MIDLQPNDLDIVKKTLTDIIPDFEVYVFGSRAAKSAKRHSDLDLLIKGNTALDKNTLRELKTAFEESNLPFRVDVVDWSAAQESFRKIIQNQMKKIF